MSECRVITIDGPAGVGKSTVARRLARALGIAYLDSGAMYRILGLNLGPQAVDMDDEDLRGRCAAYKFSLKQTQPGEDFTLFCNEVPVGDEVRSERAGRLASVVAQLPVLRQVMQEAQRGMAASHALVAEGRDMGTRVFPHARTKFFLDARPEARAERRCLELKNKGGDPDLQVILADILDRDRQDRNRSVDPLRPAADAVLVDTSDLSLDDVLAHVLARVPSCPVLLGRASAQDLPDADPDAAGKHGGPAFSHMDGEGNLRMVDVGGKQESERVARASAVVEMSAQTLALLRRNALPKGDVLATAKIAGIMAAKRTWEFIPLCHPLSISQADIRFRIEDNPPSVHIESEVRCIGRTGVEMEALVAAQIAAATIYDMAKAVQKDMIIRDVRLLYKSGGKSGVFQA